jgi:uncharacterized protein (TIRG00374 family)
MRKFLIALALLLGIIFTMARLAEVRAIGETLRQGDIRFILLAFGIQTLWLFNVAASYKLIYRLLGLDEKIETLFLVAAGANFVNVVAPSAGIGGMAVFMSAARRNGYSTARTAVAGILYLLFDYLGFLCILLLGLLVLFRRQTLTSADLVASIVLIFIASGLFVFLVLGMHSAKSLGSFLAWLANQVNRFLQPITHRQYLSPEKAHSFAQEAAGALNQIRQKPRELLLPALLGFSSKALLVSILFLVFEAFHLSVSMGTLVAAFSVSYLFFIVSPTPAGIGVVEGTLTLALNSMYVSLGAATVIALAYRGITFWVPLAFGGMALRFLHFDARANLYSNG